MTSHHVTDTIVEKATTPRSRRDILKTLGIGLTLPAAATVLAACGNQAPATTATQTSASPAASTAMDHR